MKRRTTEMNGCVNFPVNNSDYYNSNEGGMFVKLVVCDNREHDNKWEMCCGVTVNDLLAESFVGDNQRVNPEFDTCLTPADIIQAQVTSRDWIRVHYPNFDNHDPALETIEQYISRDYLAVIVLGSTGWSGHHCETNACWHCTYEDLTEQGKALYKQIQMLYPECVLHLLTFLDT